MNKCDVFVKLGEANLALYKCWQHRYANINTSTNIIKIDANQFPGSLVDLQLTECVVEKPDLFVEFDEASQRWFIVENIGNIVDDDGAEGFQAACFETLADELLHQRFRSGDKHIGSTLAWW